MKFHDKLYTLRKGANLTQNDLAEKLNVSRQAVSRWEMGTAMPDVDNLVAISELFSVTLDELLKNKEATPESRDQQSDDTKDPVLFWMRCSMILIAIGIALAIDGAVVRALFDKSFLRTIMISGFAMAGIGILIAVVLFVLNLISKDK